MVEWLISYFVIKEAKGSIPSHDIDVTWMTIIKLDACNIIVMVMPCHIIIYAMVKSTSLIGLHNHVVKSMLNNYKQM